MSNNLKKYIGLVFWLLLVTLVGAQLAHAFVSGLSIESNILKLLPNDEQDPIVEQAFKKFSEKNMQQLVFLVSHKDADTASKATEYFIESLASNQFIVEPASGATEQQQKSIAATAFKFRHQFLAESDRQLLEAEDYLAFSDLSLQQLYSPLAGGVIQLIQNDPLLLTYRKNVLNGKVQEDLKYKDGQAFLVRDDTYYFLVTASLSDSAFSPRVQESVSDSIAKIEAHWHDERIQVELLRTGALFYALHGYQTAQKEISTIGVGSLLGIIILVLGTFRSLKPLLLVTTTITTGVAVGFWVVHTWFEEVHLITLVFGASLIGVSVDYAFHYLACYHQEKNFSRLRRIFPAITLGLISSVIGYLALSTTPFPGLKQMAVFSATGLVAAYLTVVLLFPHIKVRNSVNSRLLILCTYFLYLSRSIIAKRIWYSLLLMPAVAASFFLFSPSQIENIRQFQNQNLSLSEQQRTIQELLKTPEANQFFLVKADSEESLLQKVEATESQLNQLLLKDVIGGYQSISDWLPSQKMQQENYRLYQDLYGSNALEKVAESGLFNQADIERFRQEFASQEEQVLRVSDWLSSPTGEQLGYLWLGKVENVFVTVIAIKGINDIDALADINSDVQFIDKVSTISKVFQLYKESASFLLICALGLIFLMLMFRHGIRISALVVSAPVIAISTTLVVLYLFAIPITLFNTLALFLVLGIGVDYGVFFAESRKIEPSLMMAVVLSALTTLLSFGLLSLSETPAIYAFGSTMLIGISTSLFLAPITGNLINKHWNKTA